MMDQTAGKEKFLQNSYPMKFFWLSCEPKGPTGVKICKQCIKSPVKTLFFHSLFATIVLKSKWDTSKGSPNGQCLGVVSKREKEIINVNRNYSPQSIVSILMVIQRIT